MRKTNFAPGSYEASLTEKQRLELQERLFSGATLSEIRAKSPPWFNKKKISELPSKATLTEIRRRMRVEEMLTGVAETVAAVNAAGTTLSPLIVTDEQEVLLDRAMMAIGREVMDRTLKNLNPVARTAAARLLLKRADQRRVDVRLAILKLRRKSIDQPPPAPVQSVEEKQTRVRQIFGIA